MNENLTVAIVALIAAITQLARELRRQARHSSGQLREREDDAPRCDHS